MKRVSASMLLAALLVLISSFFMSPVTADKDKKPNRKATKKSDRPLPGSVRAPASRSAVDKEPGVSELSEDEQKAAGQDAMYEDEEQDPDLPKGAKGTEISVALWTRYAAQQPRVPAVSPGTARFQRAAFRQKEFGFTN